MRSALMIVTFCIFAAYTVLHAEALEGQEFENFVIDTCFKESGINITHFQTLRDKAAKTNSPEDVRDLKAYYTNDVEACLIACYFKHYNTNPYDYILENIRTAQEKKDPNAQVVLDKLQSCKAQGFTGCEMVKCFSPWEEPYKGYM